MTYLQNFCMAEKFEAVEDFKSPPVSVPAPRNPLYDLAKIFAPLLQLAKPVKRFTPYKKRWVPRTQYKKKGSYRKRSYKKKKAWIPYDQWKKRNRR